MPQKTIRKKKFYKLTPEVEDKICSLLASGVKSKMEIARRVGVSDDTIRLWMKNDIEFAKRYNRAYDIYLLENAPSVKASLLKRAKGYTYTEKKTLYAIDKDGKLIPTGETHKTVQVPPDLAAIKLFLTNLLAEDYE